MPVMYSEKEKINPVNDQTVINRCTFVESTGKEKFRSPESEIFEHCRVKSVDTSAISGALHRGISGFLPEEYSVHSGVFGSFRTNIGEESTIKDEFHHLSLINQTKVLFRSCNNRREMLRNRGFEKTLT